LALFPFAHTHVPSRWSADPTRQALSLTSRRGRAHVRAFSGHLRTPSTPLEPVSRSPTSPCSFAPSVEHPRPLSRPARASRQLRRHSPKSIARSTIAVSPLVCLVRAHRSLPRATRVRHPRPEASPCPRRRPSAPEFALEVSNLPMPLFRLVLPQRTWF
jgi:hypothetical protein